MSAFSILRVDRRTADRKNAGASVTVAVVAIDMGKIRIATLAAAAMLAISGCWPCLPVDAPANASKYLLPFPNGTTAWVGQGYDGVFEPHHAYDFVLPEGTPVLAARDGVVTRVVDSHTGNCPFSQDCPNNLIYIRHGDGSAADPVVESRYLHIQTGSATVQVGQSVRQGDTIARVGNVGISLTSHLHFEIDQRGQPNIRGQFADIGCDDGEPQYFRFYTSRNGDIAFFNSTTTEGAASKRTRDRK